MSQRQVVRELEKSAKQTEKMNKYLGKIGKIISIISVILIIIAAFTSGMSLIAAIYTLIIDLMCEGLNELVSTLFEKFASLIPTAGIIIGFVGSWLLGKIISSIFNSNRKKKMAIAYETRTKNSTVWYDWIINFFLSFADTF